MYCFIKVRHHCSNNAKTHLFIIDHAQDNNCGVNICSGTLKGGDLKNAPKSYQKHNFHFTDSNKAEESLNGDCSTTLDFKDVGKSQATRQAVLKDQTFELKDPYVTNSRCSDFKTVYINSMYRGKRKTATKGTNAERYDVVYKTLLRSLRRYLWNIFTATYFIDEKKKNKPKNYNDCLISFYDNVLKPEDGQEADISDKQKKMIIYTLNSLMCTKFRIKRDSCIQRNLSSTLNSCLKDFSTQKYRNLFRNEGVRLLFLLIQNRGIIDKMLLTYSHLDTSRENYYKAVKKIANFSKDEILFL